MRPVDRYTEEPDTTGARAANERVTLHCCEPVVPDNAISLLTVSATTTTVPVVVSTAGDLVTEPPVE